MATLRQRAGLLPLCRDPTAGRVSPPAEPQPVQPPCPPLLRLAGGFLALPGRLVGWSAGLHLLLATGPAGNIAGFSLSPAGAKDQTITTVFLAFRLYPHPRAPSVPTPTSAAKSIPNAIVAAPKPLIAPRSRFHRASLYPPKTFSGRGIGNFAKFPMPYFFAHLPGPKNF